MEDLVRHHDPNIVKVFKNHCLFIVDIYLFFLKRQDKNSKLIFCTQQDLTSYDYLPEKLPDAYIEVKAKKETCRYFLDLFDDYRKTPGIVRFTIRKYINYSEDGSWQVGTGSKAIPTLLFVVADERRKLHIYHYAKAKLSKTFEEISLFLTTQDNIRYTKDNTNIWRQVE